jgi:hypothetical protein
MPTEQLLIATGQNHNVAFKNYLLEKIIHVGEVYIFERKTVGIAQSV